MNPGEIAIRRATDDDLPDALRVASDALGWHPDEPNEAFFRWKHLDNPAGRSPMWVAIDGDRICGFRAMLRWGFSDGSRRLAAVRAVDTATDPADRRRGIFRLLTLAAVEELSGDGIDFVFNTPNESSRPGYLKMGWVDVGRIPVRFSPTGPSSMIRSARARTPARKWSEPIDVGTAVHRAATDIAALLADMSPIEGVHTDRSLDHLLWRYGFEPLHYRVIHTDDALAIVRVRRRGPAREAVLAEILSPDAKATRLLLRTVRRKLDVDHLITVGRAPYPGGWMPTVRGLGPHLTMRSLASDPPAIHDMRFSLGDIELF